MKKRRALVVACAQDLRVDMYVLGEAQMDAGLAAWPGLKYSTQA